ncbi:Crp/Fnr family transcriptional regulator [Kitasatospora sp. GAS204B]|uniref:Crp/Fnr family transcriptional regulator n=1 Tax=unclassified Kitasatospora TaxID=2633591 RepID=UPI002474D8ED|nr:Crp/Fnr family transcriptional regulator [Kitasatospora sp. GAS204B]MDH6118014.1 CRP/FNR family cyclic AMP-dependent transcriptional regulator [Kitasatospora sp. GAS204B]
MDRLPADQAAELLALSRTAAFEAGDVLLHQGESSRHVMLLQPADPTAVACAKVTAGLEGGAETLLSIRVSGDLIGEQAALRKVPRSATVTACTPLRVAVVTSDRFLTFLGRFPEAAQHVAAVLADRLDSANRRRLDFVAYGVPIRLARVLVELADLLGRSGDGGTSIGVELSQPELGRLIGAGEDAVGQAVRRLKAEGLVRPHYRGVTVLDLRGLRRFADLAPITLETRPRTRRN